jgi:hypothetical protein
LQRQAQQAAQRQEAARLAEVARQVKLQREQKLAQDEQQRDAAIQVFRDNASRHIASFQQSERNGHSQMTVRLSEMKSEHARRLTQIKSPGSLNTLVIEAQLKIIEMRQTQQYVEFQLSQLEQLKLTLLAQLNQIQHEFAQASTLANEHYLILQTQYNTDASGDPQWWAVLSSKRDNRLTLSTSLTTDGQKATEGLSQRINVLQNHQHQLQQLLADTKVKLHQAQTTLTESLLTERRDIIRDEITEINNLFLTAQSANIILVQQEEMARQEEAQRQTLMSQNSIARQSIMGESKAGFSEIMRARSQANQTLFKEIDQSDKAPQGDLTVTMARSTGHTHYVTQI